MATGESIVRTAREYLGVRYRHQGRTRHGLDCVGLVVRVLHDLGMSDFDAAGYGRHPKPERMWATLREHCAERPRDALALGRVAFMHWGGDPMHLGIVTDHPHGFGLIHALSTSRRVVEHRIDDMWASRIVALFDLPGVG